MASKLRSTLESSQIIQQTLGTSLLGIKYLEEKRSGKKMSN